MCNFDDPAGVMAAMGLAAPGARHSHRHLVSHAATMVAAVTSIIGGVLPVAASATVGAVVTVAATAAFGWHQVRRWRAAEDSVPSLFPSHPGHGGTADLNRLGTDTSHDDS